MTELYIKSSSQKNCLIGAEFTVSEIDFVCGNWPETGARRTYERDKI